VECGEVNVDSKKGKKDSYERVAEHSLDYNPLQEVDWVPDFDKGVLQSIGYKEFFPLYKIYVSNYLDKGGDAISKLIQ
jgi:hypothetical protein